MLNKRYFKFDGSGMRVATLRCAQATARGFHNSPKRALEEYRSALSSMNRDELRKEATKAGLPGRGSMNKAELAEALANQAVRKMTP